MDFRDLKGPCSVRKTKGEAPSERRSAGRWRVSAPRRSFAVGGYLCQCIGQLRYLLAASWTGAAVVEKLAATWCSKPFSQMYRRRDCMLGISTTPAPPKVLRGSLVKAPSPT